MAASALDTASIGHNQNYGQSNDEFWRNAQQAFLEYQRLKQPGATMGGDLAAGGGGFGIVPFPGGINTPAWNALAAGSLGGDRGRGGRRGRACCAAIPGPSAGRTR